MWKADQHWGMSLYQRFTVDFVSQLIGAKNTQILTVASWCKRFLIFEISFDLGGLFRASKYISS